MLDYEQFLSKRLKELREKKDVSAREMSLAIGQNKNYINSIENGFSFPSMPTFFYICQYLNITPEEFFSLENNDPSKLNSLYADLKELDDDQLETVRKVIVEFKLAKQKSHK